MRCKHSQDNPTDNRAASTTDNNRSLSEDTQLMCGECLQCTCCQFYENVFLICFKTVLSMMATHIRMNDFSYIMSSRKHVLPLHWHLCIFPLTSVQLVFFKCRIHFRDWTLKHLWIQRHDSFMVVVAQEGVKSHNHIDLNDLNLSYVAHSSFYRWSVKWRQGHTCYPLSL